MINPIEVIATPISLPLEWLITSFAGMGLDGAIAIALAALIVRIALFRLALSERRSVARWDAIRPEITKIREETEGDDVARANRLGALWRERNVSPLDMLAPSILQAYIYLGLLWAVIHADQGGLASQVMGAMSEPRTGWSIALMLVSAALVVMGYLIDPDAFRRSGKLVRLFLIGAPIVMALGALLITQGIAVLIFVGVLGNIIQRLILRRMVPRVQDGDEVTAEPAPST